MQQEALDLLALALVPNLGTRGALDLLERFQTASEVLGLSRSDLARCGVSAEAQIVIATGKARREAQRVAEKCRRSGIGILTRTDDGYPELLAQIFDPPLVLYYLGQVDLLKTPSVAVVGARRCSPYGKEVTLKLAAELAGFGLTVVSGLARGIDSTAHRGALEVEGKTVAVLGTGVDVVYPKENRKLYGRIRETGCIISEFPLKTFPLPQNFPIRNRIISGLCYGTVIPEAAEFSGSLITARLTLEQDRDIWAVPGNITNPKSYGPNYLIKQGAHPFITAQDVLDELPVFVLNRLRPVEEEAAEPMQLDEDQQVVLKQVRVDETVHLDILARRLQWPVARLSAVLLDLELKGKVRSWPGRCYSLRL